MARSNGDERREKELKELLTLLEIEEGTGLETIQEILRGRTPERLVADTARLVQYMLLKYAIEGPY